jgi:phosphatidylglycerol---prolipoprotein diacylglyceryl transferase
MLPTFTLLSYQIYTYPLILGIIWACSYHLAKALLVKNSSLFKYFNFYFSGVFLSSWGGAKILFLLTVSDELALRAISATSFWFGGGFVFFGGLIGGSIFSIWFGIRYQLPLFRFSFLIPIIALGHGIGRVGCFLAGCCYGQVCELPWSIHMHGQFRHPVQLYEAILLGTLAWYFYKQYLNKKSIVLEYIFLYSLLRFVIEFFRGDKIRGNVYGLMSTSQGISLCLMFCCAWFLYVKRSNLRTSR